MRACARCIPFQRVKVCLYRRSSELGSSVSGNHLKRVQEVLLEAKVTEQHVHVRLLRPFVMFNNR